MRKLNIVLFWLNSALGLANLALALLPQPNWPINLLVFGVCTFGATWNYLSWRSWT